MSRSEHDSLDRDVRLRVYRAFVERGHPPSFEQIASELSTSLDEVRGALERLAAGRALIHSKNRDRIEVAPPFSAVPTPFWVSTDRGSWWGNCAWESLGIAGLLGVDAHIATTSGACGERIELEVKREHVVPADVVMHIALPAKSWWNDVGYTCGTLLFFRSETEVEPWCVRHGIPRGRVLSSAQAWKLAQRWFSGRLERDWRRLTLDEAHASFRDAGLLDEFFRLD